MDAIHLWGFTGGSGTMKARETRVGKKQETQPGKTRWERMEHSTFTLEHLSEAHAAAYLAENKSHRTIEWHTAAIHRFAQWVRSELHAEPTLVTLTLDNARRYTLHLQNQPRYAGHPTNEQPDQRLSDESVSFYLRGLRAFASWLEREGFDFGIFRPHNRVYRAGNRAHRGGNRRSQ